VLFRFSEDLRDLAEVALRKHGIERGRGPALARRRKLSACQKAVEAGENCDLGNREAFQSESNAKEPRKSVCLTHLEGLLHVLSNTTTAKRILLQESEAFRRIAENLQRYALRHEGRRSDSS